jgi:hypothetical protein
VFVCLLGPAQHDKQSEIKPVEPGQGNACEGKELTIYLSQQHFPLIFLKE